MEGRGKNVLQPFEEAWFDLAYQTGKEFQRPNLSNSIHPSDKLVFLQDPKHHSPSTTDNCYQSESDPSFAGNEISLYSIMEMVSSITNYGPSVDDQQVTQTSNHYNFSRSNSFLISKGLRYEKTVLGN